MFRDDLSLPSIVSHVKRSQYVPCHILQNVERERKKERYKGVIMQKRLTFKMNLRI